MTNSVVTSTVLAGLVAVTSGLIALFGHQESWLRNRKSASQLQALRARFDHGFAPFDGPDREGLFADEVEKILGGDIEQWGKQVDASRAQALQALKNAPRIKFQRRDPED